MPSDRKYTMKRYTIPLMLLLAAIFLVLPVAAVTADFSYTADSSNSLTIRFTGQSSGADTWYWSFGEGGNSQEQSPTYTYDSPGTYRVTFTANGPDDSAETKKEITVSRGGSGSSGSSGTAGDSGSGTQNQGSGSSSPALSLGGLSIPNPLNLISEYIQLIKTMLNPANYHR